MSLLNKLNTIWHEIDAPFLIYQGRELFFADVLSNDSVDLAAIHVGDVVALIGDFDPKSISTLLRLIDLGAIVVPLTADTKHDHEYFFESAEVDVVICDGSVRRLKHSGKNGLIKKLRDRSHAGLILFSTGTTGRPKAILHDLSDFLLRFETPRPALRTLTFLLFDHIGGINTLMHTLFNRGCIITPDSRSVDSILSMCEKFCVEVLPTTPTFLRMMLMSGMIPDRIPRCLRVITYGTERMDQPTLDALCDLLPDVDFRQTFGMSELGILRIKSESRNSLFMKIGGEGVVTRVINNVLEIKSASAMLGYLNADSPFDQDGWYCTKDIVDQKGDFIKVVGRNNDVINVGGLKFMASEVERVALCYPGIELVKAEGKSNPITGQHVVLQVQPCLGCVIDPVLLMSFMRESLQEHMMPKRVLIDAVRVGHRFKKV